MLTRTDSGTLEQPIEQESAKAMLLFANFGLYHNARLNALKEVCPTHAIEFAAVQNLYGWQVNKETTNFTTLYDGAIEQASIREVLNSCVRLWKTMEGLSPSHVFVPGYVDVRAVVAAVWARLHRAQSILMYESTERDRVRTASTEFLKRLLIRLLFSHGFVGGTRTRQYLEKLKFPPSKLVQKYDIVDNDFFTVGCSQCRNSSKREDWGLPTNYFLFVARLAEEKNAAGLLEAFTTYRREGGAWELVLVGRGGEEANLKSMAAASGFEHVIHFAGFKNAEELWPFYAFANCFVLPSKAEPWGLVVNEAMASGLPVLVSDACGCAPDLVHEGKNGFSFNPCDSSQLTRLLHRLSTLTFEERTAMGNASREIIARFAPSDWGNSAREIMSLWRRPLGLFSRRTES
jgi:glycosyltransferase involved in cell wall biosynthesis